MKQLTREQMYLAATRQIGKLIASGLTPSDPRAAPNGVLAYLAQPQPIFRGPIADVNDEPADGDCRKLIAEIRGVTK